MQGKDVHTHTLIERHILTGCVAMAMSRNDVIPLISKACVRFIYLIVLSQRFLAALTPKRLAPLGREAESRVTFCAFKQSISCKLLTVGRTSHFRDAGRFQS